VGNPVERTELIRTHPVTGGKVSAEMLKASPTSRAEETLVFEPCIDFRD
jgi:hypothetical protein